MAWQIFERAAADYERWYREGRGRRADLAERALLGWLFEPFAGVRSVLEVGSGTGHFCGWLAESGVVPTGLERSPAMVAQARREFPGLRFVLGDAHRLPFGDESFDVAMFVTTLEFLDDPAAAIAEAARVARAGIVALVLNRISIGGLSRRFGPQSRGSLLAQAHDYSIGELRRALSAPERSAAADMRWASTLFPNGLWSVRAQMPLGDVIGASVCLRT